MAKLKMEIGYDGSAFHGWQVQPGQETIQSELEHAFYVYIQSLAKKQGVEAVDSVRITASGRTDTGVHAQRQVCSLEWPEHLKLDADDLLVSLNALTGRSLVVNSVEQCDDAFDARHSEHVKCYEYRILLQYGYGGLDFGRVWAVNTQGLNIAAMIKAANGLKGTHDFAAFRASDCCAQTTVRTLLSSEVYRESEKILVYSVQGKGFLKQMVRSIVGTLYEVGMGRLPTSTMQDLIESGDRQRVGQTAPACGLTLKWVRYLE